MVATIGQGTARGKACIVVATRRPQRGPIEYRCLDCYTWARYVYLFKPPGSQPAPCTAATAACSAGHCQRSRAGFQPHSRFPPLLGLPGRAWPGRRSQRPPACATTTGRSSTCPTSIDKHLTQLAQQLLFHPSPSAISPLNPNPELIQFLGFITAPLARD